MACRSKDNSRSQWRTETNSSVACIYCCSGRGCKRLAHTANEQSMQHAHPPAESRRVARRPLNSLSSFISPPPEISPASAGNKRQRGLHLLQQRQGLQVASAHGACSTRIRQLRADASRDAYSILSLYLSPLHLKSRSLSVSYYTSLIPEKVG